MQIWHRIGFHQLDGVERSLNTLGVEYKKVPLPGASYLVVFDIAETDPSWSAISLLVEQKRASDLYDTVFTSEEILAADWLRLKPTFEHGYPQPEDTFEWRDNTYSFVCPECGIVDKQKAPFYLKKEPKMGKNDFLSLYWAYTMFSAPKVFARFNENQFQGYVEREVMIQQTNQASQLITQLDVLSIASEGLAEEDKLQPETCPVCGITKYLYHKRGYMHIARSAIRSDVDFQLTHEWFGSGGKAGFREFLVSQRVAQLILGEGWRGVALKPVKLVG